MPFSFLNTAFLVGLAAAALPILIHLFSRRRVTRVPFSTLQFLEEITRRRVRRVRLTQWIILALRVLALALLALALGRPAFQGDFALGKSRGESVAAIVLDRSFSMAAEGPTGPIWEAAKARANEVLDALDPEDHILLVGMDPLHDEVEPYPGRQATEDALRGLRVGFGTTDLAAGIRRAAGALSEVTALNKELFVISDFQRSGLGTGTEIGVTDLSSEIEDRVRIYLLPVSEVPLANSSLELARLEGSPVDQRVLIQIARHAETPLDDVSITVESGTEVLGEAIASVPMRSRETAQVPLLRLPGEGEELRARLAYDLLPIDDVRYVPALGAGQVKTLVVQDPAQPSPFLPLALAPTTEGGRFEVEKVSPASLAAIDLSAARLLVLDNVTSLPREALLRLRNWRAAGGALLVVLGDRVDLRHYNESLLPALMDGVRLGTLLGTDEATGVSYSLVPRVAGHASFIGFDAEVGKPVTGASFWRVIEVQNGPGMLTLAEFGPGLPAMVQGDRALLLATSLDGRWNNFPTHSAFVPLLHQSLDAILKEGSGDQVHVGEPVVGVVDPAVVPSGTDILCYGPNGIVLDVVSRTIPRGVELRSDPAPEPGFYTIRAQDRALVRGAVNVDTAESDLTPLGRDEILKLFPGDRVEVFEAGVAIGEPIREARYGREFWREIVLLVLLIMGVEAWLSRRGVA